MFSLEFFVTTGAALIVAWALTGLLLRSLLYPPRRAGRNALAIYILFCACAGSFGMITMQQDVSSPVSNWSVEIVYNLVVFVFVALAWPPLALLGLSG